MTEETLHEILKELRIITEILKSMKKQEFDYWEVWKQAKSKENHD